MCIPHRHSHRHSKSGNKVSLDGRGLELECWKQGHMLHLSGTTESLLVMSIWMPPNPPLFPPLSLSISSVYSLCVYSILAVYPEFTLALVLTTNWQISVADSQEQKNLFSSAKLFEQSHQVKSRKPARETVVFGSGTYLRASCQGLGWSVAGVWK